jgi:ADP-ribose pyrophosphatase YjhB (NUDIX family)
MKVSISAGTAILYKNKILLCHPTTLPWVNSFSPPKGGIDNDETLLEAALRETSEEVGIHLDVSQISNPDDPIEVL